MTYKAKKIIFKEKTPADSRKKLRDKLLPLLMDKVFHVTPYANYDEIKKTGIIECNSALKFRPASGYKEYWAQKNGHVSLFDLRNKNNSVIDEALISYYFLDPQKQNHSERNVFLILDEDTYSDLKYPAIGEKGYRIQCVECGYPDGIPLDNVCEIIDVTVVRQLPPFVAALEKIAIEKVGRSGRA